MAFTFVEKKCHKVSNGYIPNTFTMKDKLWLGEKEDENPLQFGLHHQRPTCSQAYP